MKANEIEDLYKNVSHAVHDLDQVLLPPLPPFLFVYLSLFFLIPLRFEGACSKKPLRCCRASKSMTLRSVKQAGMRTHV